MDTTEKIKSAIDLFADELKKSIADYVLKNGRYAGWHFWIKAISLLLIWAFLYVYIVFYSTSVTTAYLLSLAWGLCSLLIIFNIGHDAVHAVVSRSKKINNVLKYSFNLVGGNAYSWKLKHNIAHHIHTNIEGLDFDTDMSPLMRLSPQTKYQKQYRWQHFTFLLIYPLLSLLIIFVADFKIFDQTKKAHLIKSHPAKEWIILLLSKLWYLNLVFIIPLVFSPYSILQILIAFISLHIINGIVIACVFMPSHYFPGSEYYEQKAKDYNWFEHQLSTTMDLSPENSLISFILGGLNLNVAHHLFPKICHTHYYELSKIIRKKAKQYGIVYHVLPYSTALAVHVKYLKSLTREHA